MVKRKNIVIAYLFFVSIVSIAQTVVLPDTNFRNKLLANYPQVMQGEQLLVSEAAKLSAIDLRNANLSDVTGITYFTGLNSLDLTNNKLVHLPNMAALVNLEKMYLNYNQLTSLPSLSSLTNLGDFQVMGNQLATLPSLPASIRLFYCSGNKLTQFPSLTQFVNLEKLIMGDNKITNTLDFSKCINLVDLHIHKLELDTIIGLDKLVKLKNMYAWGNNIKDFGGLDSITTLEVGVLFNNPLTQLPYLQNKPNLVNLNISNCKLTFEDIVPVLQQNPPATFTYAPQKNVVMNDVTVRAQTNALLTAPIASSLSTNNYVWFKETSKLDSSAFINYSISAVTTKDEGNYVLKIYNADAPLLTLKSDSFSITVLPCLDLHFPSVDVVNKDCSRGYTIDLSHVEINGGTPPFTFTVFEEYTQTKAQGKYLKNLPAGKYEFALTDSNQCKATALFDLERIEGCDPVITPNNDGIMDYYLIDKPGQVKVYDMKRNLVKTLQAPASWDGTNQDGALLESGYYIIIPEGAKPLFITLIR